MQGTNEQNMKIIAFGASYSSDSINKTFAGYATKYFPEADTEVLDLRNFELPLYTADVEAAIGHPAAALDFVAKLDEADVLIVSLAEHNGSYTTAFKNLFDWASRVKLNFFEGKKMLLLSTAPGPRGGVSALKAAAQRFPIHGATIVGTFSLPHFHENFSDALGILNEGLRKEFEQVIGTVSIGYEQESYASH